MESTTSTPATTEILGAGVPSRIVLQERTSGRYDERIADAANLYPGQLMVVQTDGGVNLPTVVGQKIPLIVAIENVMKGTTILDANTSGDPVPLFMPVSGDKFLGLLQNGQTVTIGQFLMSAGDGTLMLQAGPIFADIVADSTVVTGTSAETVFSNGSVSLPANTLKVGDRIRVRGKVFLVARNSTNTHTINIYAGGALAGSIVITTGALALQANDYVEFDVTFTVRTTGASGTIVGDAFITYTAGGVVTVLAANLASVAYDTTVAEAVRVTTTASAASAGNQIKLQQFYVMIDRVNGGFNPLVMADAAADNSGGTGTGPSSAMFVPVRVI